MITNKTKYCYLTYSNHLLDISTTDLNFFPDGISLIYDDKENGKYGKIMGDNTYREYYGWCKNFDSENVSQISYNYHSMLVDGNDYYISLAGASCTFNKGDTSIDVTEGNKTTYA